MKNHPQLHKQQKGIALFVVIVIVLVSTLFTLWASRSSLFNELVIGNDADYQRAFEAAQALMQDAEFDISGKRPDGEPCAKNRAVAAPICRPAGTNIWFPTSVDQTSDILSILAAESTQCLAGICAKRTNEQDFWLDPDTLNAMIANGVAARYGQFTGAQVGAVNSKTSNPILKKTAAGEGGWYWVEPMLYQQSAGTKGLVEGASTGNFLELSLESKHAYRITAIARGLKPGTQVVLQSTYVMPKAGH